MSKALHNVQQQLLKLLEQHADDPLTIRQMQEEVGASSPSVVAHHLQQLEKKGYLKRNPYNPKDYQLVSGSPESMVTHVNCYGMAACGPSGTLLNGDPVDKIPIASRLLSFPAAEAFMVKAKGKSMEPKIYEGDLVIARRTNAVENGKVYVCVNDGEVLIKRVQLLNTKTAPMLHSFNPDVESFLADAAFHVEGEVRGVISGRVF